MAYLYLTIAIIAEVTATTALKACDSFTKLAPSLVVVVGYGLSLLFLSITLRTIPVGIAYAIWAGAGTAFIVLSGALVLGQTLDAAAIGGIGLIVTGVVVINLLSAATVH
jgi:small multidrug resistance pump